MKENINYEEKLKKAQGQINELYEELKKDYNKLGIVYFEGEDKKWKDEKNKIYTHINDFKKNIEEAKKIINIAKGIKDINKDFINKFECSLGVDEEIINKKIEGIKERIDIFDKRNNLFYGKAPVIEKDIKKNNEVSEEKMSLDLINEQLENMKKIEKMQNEYLNYIEQNVENVEVKKLDNEIIKAADKKDLSNKKQVNKKKKGCIIL